MSCTLMLQEGGACRRSWSWKHYVEFIAKHLDTAAKLCSRHAKAGQA